MICAVGFSELTNKIINLHNTQINAINVVENFNPFIGLSPR